MATNGFESLINEDIKKNARSADKLDKQRAESFQPMMNTAGWNLFIQLLDLRIQALSDELLVPSGSLDRMVGSEWIKGAMYGLLLARNLPSVTIESMKEQGPQPDGDDSDTTDVS